MSSLAFNALDTMFSDIASNQATGLDSDKKFFLGNGFLMENQPLGAGNVEVVSTSSADTMNVTVYGVRTGNRNVVVNETKALTGTTAVLMTSYDDWYYVIGIVVASSPTGDVSVRAADTDRDIAIVTAAATGANLYNIESGFWGSLDSAATPAEVRPDVMIVGKNLTLFAADSSLLYGNYTFSGNVTINGNLTFGDASFDLMLINGRVATVTAESSAIAIDATFDYESAIELRYQVTNFTHDDFTGMYLRSEAITNAATAKSLYGTQIHSVCNNVTMTTGSLFGTLTYAYVKGAGLLTINNIYAGQFELSWDAGRTADCTITTEAAVLLAKVTGGRVADYTKIHGLIVRFGEMDGDSQLFGSAIKVEDDASMSGTSTFTVGLNIAAGCTDGIILAGAMTRGILISGASSSYGISVTGTATTAGIAVSGSAGIGFSVLTGTFTTGLSLAGIMSGSAISIAPPSGTTALGITFASGTITTAINIASTTVTGIAIGACTTYGISFTGATTATGISFAGTVTTGILFSAITTTGINFSVAPTSVGIGMVGGSSYLGLRIGTFHTSAAGSGVIVSDAIKRACDVLCDDNGVGTTGAQFISSARFRLMGTGTSYLGEAYALHGLFKYSPVTTTSCTTSSYTAGILGAFEWTASGGGAVNVAAGYHGGIIGRVGGGAVQVAISANSYVAGLIAGNNMSSAATGDGKTVGFLATAFNTQDWDIGFKVDASTCSTGVSIGTSGTGIDFPSGSTYTVGAVKCGTFDNPIVFTGDELWEIHGRVSSATDSKPLFRIRNSAFAGSMTTGSITTLEVTAYGSLTGSSNLFEVRAINAGAGIKSASTLITGAFMTAGRFKLEDLGFDLTANAGSNLAVLDLRWQFNTGTTLSGTSAWINCYHEGNISLNAQTIIGGLDATGSGIADYFFAIPTGSSSNIPFYASGCSVTVADHPYLKCNIGGANYAIPMIAL